MNQELFLQLTFFLSRVDSAGGDGMEGGGVGWMEGDGYDWGEEGGNGWVGVCRCRDGWDPVVSAVCWIPAVSSVNRVPFLRGSVPKKHKEHD